MPLKFFHSKGDYTPLERKFGGPLAHLSQVLTYLVYMKWIMVPHGNLWRWEELPAVVPHTEWAWYHYIVRIYLVIYLEKLRKL